jgi:hypothetical protein
MKWGSTTIRSVVRMAALPAIVLGMGFLVCGTSAHADVNPCRNDRSSVDCGDHGKPLSVTVPEPSSLIQLAAGLFVLGTLGILGRKRLFATKS